MDANKFNAALGIKKMTHHGNNLVWALDSVVRNAELISDKYLSVPDFKGRPLTYDYLRIKGAEQYLVIRKFFGSNEKQVYDIVSKLH